MVVAELRFAAKHDQALRLVIRNAGPSIARNLTVTFDPPLVEMSNRLAVGAINKQFARPLASLSPGQQVANLWWRIAFPSQELPPGSNGEDTPDEVVVQLDYSDDRGRTYIDKIPLSVVPYLSELLPSKKPGNRDPDTAHIAQALILIADRQS